MVESRFQLAIALVEARNADKTPDRNVRQSAIFAPFLQQMIFSNDDTDRLAVLGDTSERQSRRASTPDYLKIELPSDKRHGDLSHGTHFATDDDHDSGWGKLHLARGDSLASRPNFLKSQRHSRSQSVASDPTLEIDGLSDLVQCIDYSMDDSLESWRGIEKYLTLDEKEKVTSRRLSRRTNASNRSSIQSTSSALVGGPRRHSIERSRRISMADPVLLERIQEYRRGSAQCEDVPSLLHDNTPRASRSVSSPAVINTNEPVQSRQPFFAPLDQRSFTQSSKSPIICPTNSCADPPDGKMGIAAFLPRSLVIPEPLYGTKYAPSQRLSGKNRMTESNKDTGMVRQQVPQLAFMTPEGKKKHESLVLDLREQQRFHRRSPAKLPNGLDPRKATRTTALFRNQLVRADEDKDGWGWQFEHDTVDDSHLSSNDVGVSDNEADLSLECKKRRWFRLHRTNTIKDRAKRKQASRERRRKRQVTESHAMPYEALGVLELSPDEDLDLSDLSEEEMESGSDIDDLPYEGRPAGRLYGTNLLDGLEDRKQKIKAKARFYGEHQAGDCVDNPNHQHDVAVNDTHERMVSIFGKDTLWEREMAAKQTEENTLQAQENAKGLQSVAHKYSQVSLKNDHMTADESRSTSPHAPTIQLQIHSAQNPVLDRSSVMGDVLSEMDAESDNSSLSDRNYEERCREAQRILPKLAKEEREDDSDSENIPLSSLRARLNTTDVKRMNEKDEEETPLALLVAKKFPSKRCHTPIDAQNKHDDDIMPLGIKYPNGLPHSKRTGSANGADPDDDEPLGRKYGRRTLSANKAHNAPRSHDCVSFARTATERLDRRNLTYSLPVPPSPLALSKSPLSIPQAHSITRWAAKVQSTSSHPT